MQNAKSKVQNNDQKNCFAVFLDRDGTIIDDLGYIRRTQDVHLLPHAVEGLHRLQAAGFALIVVSNQSGLARGIITEEEHQSVWDRFFGLLKDEGVTFTDYLYCPHHPEGVVEKYRCVCDCRKGKPGMLLEAARRHQIMLAGSWMIGDSPVDIEAGRSAGVRTIRVGPVSADKNNTPPADFYADNLADAATILLSYKSVS